MRFGMPLVTLKHHLKAHAGGKPTVAARQQSLQEVVASAGLTDLGDTWEEAQMCEVAFYLRANYHLKLPDWARPLLPTAI